MKATKPSLKPNANGRHSNMNFLKKKKSQKYLFGFKNVFKILKNAFN